jgi:CheY-like chemotaxis protein
MAERRALQGLRVLIAEDNLFAAMELESALLDLGCEPVGPVAQLDQALRLARQEHLDGALLDVDLRGELVFAVAEELERRRIPVVFASATIPTTCFRPGSSGIRACASHSAKTRSGACSRPP